MPSMLDKKIPSYLRPLFWQHGESEELLADEVAKMHENGIHGFIVEARPHPDFLSYGWWRDLTILLKEAKKRGMEMWIFDDGAYPSGHGAGKIKALYPEALKIYMKEVHIDAIGPMKGASINIGYWIQEGESLLKVIMAARADRFERLDERSLYDVTDQVMNGSLYMDIPEGEWRIFIIKKTRNGGENWTKDYVNPISEYAVQKYIDIIYEEHYKHFKEEFGQTIKGFFVDEPRFGNVAGYEEPLGKAGNVLPYCDDLLEELSKEFGRDFSCYLPFLWSRENPICSDVHYAYMNVVSRLFSENFIGQIGKWCRDHGVKVIGHVVEDNAAHARLGYGPGHFFRSMEGFDAAGLDIVYQIWPERMEGRFSTPFGYLYSEFFYWGLCKMASSAAHIDAAKNGVTMCEIFGAYGWQEGLKLMKWLTDHACVRGINLLVPHAFSPKFPDEDCPPHFYARGNNPQWEYFHIWSEYANRVCHLLTDGCHIATAAVLYHAEAEWGGAYEPFEKAVHALMAEQIDCDVIPADTLCKPEAIKVQEGKLLICKEAYQVLIVPYAENISRKLLQTMINLAEAGLPVVFMNGTPKHIYYEEQGELLDKLKTQDNITVLSYETLPQWMREHDFVDVIPDQPDKYLRCCHYQKDGRNIYFFTNESKHHPIHVTMTIREKTKLLCYDAMADECYILPTELVECGSSFELKLHPYESLFVMEEAGERIGDYHPLPLVLKGDERLLSEGWTIQIAENKKMDKAIGWDGRLKNLAEQVCLPHYSGKITYTNTFDLTAEELSGKAYLDLGEVYEISEVWLNDIPLGVRICPPYAYNLTGILKEHNTLRVDVTNTYVREKGNNVFDASLPQEPSGLIGPVRVVMQSL